MEDHQDEYERDMDVAAARLSDILPRPEEKSVKQKIVMYGGEEDRTRCSSEISPTPANSPARTETKKRKRKKFYVE